MKRIELSKMGSKYQNVYTAIVDDEDLEKVSCFNWSVLINYRNVYAVRNVNKKNIYLHSLILNSDKPIDHINGNGLDNRKSNLRLITVQQNSANSKIRIDNSSGFKGVTWNKNANKWQAQIRNKYKRIYIGLYNTPKEAAKAYNDKAVDLHGEYARLNVIADCN
jgi:hypothetical protein